MISSKNIYQLEKKYQNFLSKLKGPILILGGGGFIGFNLLNSIYLYRQDVYAVSSNPEKNWRFKISSFPQKNIIKANLLIKKQVNKLIQKIKPQTIFNLTAYGAYSHQNNLNKIYQTNFISSVNIIENLRKTQHSAYVYAGSSSEYGFNCSSPQENDEMLPNSHYSVSKIANYYLQKFYAQIHNFPTAHLRLYSVYGPWEDPSRLIPNLIKKTKKNLYPPFVDPDISRDFIYTTDVVQAFISTAYKIKKIKGQVFNIGTGKKTTIKQLAFLIKKIYKIKKNPVFNNMKNRKWDQKNWYSNPQKAQKILKWKAKTSLEIGLKKTTYWQKYYNI